MMSSFAVEPVSGLLPTRATIIESVMRKAKSKLWCAAAMVALVIPREMTNLIDDPELADLKASFGLS